MRLFLKNLIFSLVVPGMVGGYFPWLVGRGQSLAPQGCVVISAILFLLGGTIYLRCLWDFAAFGRGTPAPIDAPKRLVVRGLYRYTRNPMYVGALTAILGWAVLYQSLPLVLYALCVGTVFHLFVVLYEEPHLRRVFGAQYVDYCARVGRWLPRVFSNSTPRSMRRPPE